MIDNDVFEMSRDNYNTFIGADEYTKNDRGKIQLIPVERVVEESKRELDDNIDALAERLKTYKEEKKRLDNLPKPKSGGKKKKKKQKKERETILKMIFNNADTRNAANKADDEEYEEQYRDIKKRGPAEKKKKEDNNLDTTYGQRFSPVISLLYDNIGEFDDIIDMIEEDLEKLGPIRNRYKTDQMGNLISAKNAKLSAIKELGSLSKTISDLEYKKAKDESKNEESDSTKALSALGVKFLKGATIDDDKKKKSKSKTKSTREKFHIEDDDDDDDFKSKKKSADKQLAEEFTNSIFGKKNKFELTPHERHIGMEGKYKIVVVANHRDPENDWKFAAVDDKGREIKGFKDEYKDLLPKKKGSKYIMDLEKMKVKDTVTTKSYKLILR